MIVMVTTQKLFVTDPPKVFPRQLLIEIRFYNEILAKQTSIKNTWSGIIKCGIYSRNRGKDRFKIEGSFKICSKIVFWSFLAQF